MIRLIAYLMFSLLFFVELLPQNAKGQSGYIKLDIKFPPPDILSPEVEFELPMVYEGYPFYSRDSIYTLNCVIHDDSKKIKTMISDQDLGYIVPGANVLKVNLKLGENKVNILFTDKSNNSTKKEITFFYDPSADVTPPMLMLDPPFSELSRGIQVVEKDSFDSLVVISGDFSDQTKILGIWINGIPADTITKNHFYYSFRGDIPDTVELKIADIFGNLTVFNAKLEEPLEVELGADLNDITYHALIIGINSYSDPNFNDLDGPIKDGQNLAKVLQEFYNFDKQNIKILKNPTRAQIIKAFDEYKKKLNENCNLLIFYAGHGKFDEDTETGYWLPSDVGSENTSNWIQNSSIRDYLKAIKTQHTLVISDACFSGSILRDFFPDAEKSINEIYRIKSRRAMVSGSEVAPDKSVFVEYLIKNLKSIDRPYFTAQWLFSKIKEPVINNSKTDQYPEYKSIHLTGDEGMQGDFVFSKKIKNPEKK
jgi:hypothetical protein